VHVCDHVPLLVILMPRQPTANGLMREMLRGLGDPRYRRRQGDELFDTLVDFVGKCRTKTILIDEGQRAVDRDGVMRRYDIAEFLKDLLDRVHLTMAVFGMGRTRVLFQHDAQVWRRFDNEIAVPPFDWGQDIEVDGSDPEAETRPPCRLAFLNVLVTYESNLPVPFAADLDPTEDGEAFKFFYASRGTIGLLEKLLIKAVSVARKLGEETIDSGVLRAAFKKAFINQIKEERLSNPWEPGWVPQLPPAVEHERLLARPKKPRAPKKSERRARLRRALTKD
jgi:hypothetical protein